MNLIQYMEAKYKGSAYAITKKEAEVIGIPYPPPRGWVDVYGTWTISDEQLKKLSAMAYDRAYKAAKKKKNKEKAGRFFHYASNILDVVGGGEK